MLAHLVPAPLVRVFARPYIAGDSTIEALETAATLFENQGLTTTLDLLGEDVVRPEQVEANEGVYRGVIDALAADPRFSEGARRPSVSLKPSAFSIDSPKAAFSPIRRLAEYAHAKKVALTIDMESSRWTDLTIEHAVQLYKEGLDVGTVLQTRLNRTERDLESIPEGMRIRLVIGIYPEPADIATTEKRVMKERMLTSAETLLDRGVYVEFATHDDAFVTRFAESVAPRAPDRCEVQMLLGVPRPALQQKLLAGGFGPRLPVRMYVPFAVGWDDATAYLRRRMEESPSVIFSVLKNLFPRRGK